MNSPDPDLITGFLDEKESQKARSEMIRLLYNRWSQEFSTLCSSVSCTRENDSEWPCLKIEFNSSPIRVEICLTPTAMSSQLINLSEPSLFRREPEISRSFDGAGANLQNLFELILDMMREQNLLSPLSMLIAEK